jgi:hypothetical protein
VPEVAALAELGVKCVLDGELVTGAGLPTDLLSVGPACPLTDRPWDDVRHSAGACGGTPTGERVRRTGLSLLE